ncbi:MAG: hypothetical protein OK454_11710, partial [Thaumarchaeota archaeon]|nr:hypothetical protein [Nitrososphaerota archaeon]
MQPLNAIDAISPAFTRTHETLFTPFSMGRSWKLAASQYLGWCGAMFIPFPLFFFLFPTNSIPGFNGMRGFFLVISLIVSLVGLVIFYFCARMEMVCFEMILTRSKFIAPMWRRYAHRIWPWIGLKILVGTIFGAIVFAAFYAPVHHVMQGVFASFPVFTPGEKPDPVAMQAFFAGYTKHILSMELIFGALFFLMKIPSTLLNDFVLPFYILEDIPLVEALRRGLNVFLADPLQCLLYLILKPILFVIGYFIQYIAMLIAMIPVIIVFVIVAVIAGIAGFSLSHSGAGSGVLAVMAIVIGYGLFLAFTVYI